MTIKVIYEKRNELYEQTEDEHGNQAWRGKEKGNFSDLYRMFKEIE